MNVYILFFTNLDEYPLHDDTIMKHDYTSNEEDYEPKHMVTI